MPETKTTWSLLIGLALLVGLLVIGVVPGKVLAQIDTPELDQELGQARAALAQTRSGLAQARASLVQAQATLNQARAGLDQSKTNEDFAGITAQRFTRLEHDGLVAH